MYSFIDCMNCAETAPFYEQMKNMFIFVFATMCDNMRFVKDEFLLQYILRNLPRHQILSRKRIQFFHG
jgi:hypothetical protein